MGVLFTAPPFALKFRKMYADRKDATSAEKALEFKGVLSARFCEVL
jgi:hypothetical protein